MEELSVRRNRSFTVSRYQGTGKMEKASGTVKTQQIKAGQTADMISETLRKLMGSVDRVGQQVREGRRTLLAGEAALAEVEDSLARMEELARQSAQDGTVDRAALQEELERLRGEIDRIAQGGVQNGLFQEGDGTDSADALADALLNGLEAQQAGAQSLPAWLVHSMVGPAPDRETLMAALGVNRPVSGAELLTIVGQLRPESSRVAGYLAGLYLGSVISGSTDPEQAAEGLNELLRLVAKGMELDEAIDLLTGGMFTGLDDFYAQYISGTAPGLENFLLDILSGSDFVLPSLTPLPGDYDPLMVLLMALENAGGGLDLLAKEAQEGSDLVQGSGDSPAGEAAQWESVGLGTVQASGRDLSGAAFDPKSGTVTVDGTAELTLRGQEGQEALVVRLVGEGALTLQQMRTALTVQSSQAKVVLAGENTLSRLTLGEGTVLTLEGHGLTHIGVLRGGASSVLRLTGGAVVLSEESSGSRSVPVVVDGPVSLLAANEVMVQDPQGDRLSPLDIVWKTMLPGWSCLSSLMVDGKRTQFSLTDRDQADPLRLWLAKGNENQGFPAHSIVLQGRSQAGQLRVRYAYVRWDQRTKSFQEIEMYPNPFTVTGGEPGTDWRYEEEAQTLHILTGQVTALSGGTGTDGDELPFSGRLALADGIGRVELTLEGVECRVSAGRAFSLGRGNSVTLLLQSGSVNIFESGPGCAGVSLGAGTSLCIDRVKGPRGEPEGKLIATGGSGGAGIGRDSGAGRERSGSILIRGGVVTATGAGGGAGIGGAVGSSAGDIRIQGGTVTTQAACCAAAIGAGIQGSCGDITITSFARVEKAQGGGPDGDIGGCLFGNCGKLQVSSCADLGGAKLWNQKGLSLQVGEATLTLPRFRVSAQALRLDSMDLTTREAAQAALAVLATSRRWVGRLQGAYGVMYGQLAQSVSGLYGAQRYVGVVREDSIAGLLLRDARQTLRQDPMASYRLREMENVGQLLR